MFLQLFFHALKHCPKGKLKLNKAKINAWNVSTYFSDTILASKKAYVYVILHNYLKLS